jgi:type I restriction enzyme S subunit
VTTAQRSTLNQFLEFKNGKTSPKRSDKGKFAVFGSNGEIGRSDSANAAGPLIVIGRVGSYCGSLFYSEADAWVTDNAIVCSSKDSRDTRYWYYALQTLGLNGRSSGSGQPLLNQGVLGGIAFDPPEPEERRVIAAILGALDDKIAANTQLAATSMRLAETYFNRTMRLATDERALGEILSLEYGKSLPTSSRVTGPIDVYGSGGITGSHNEALCPDPGVVVGRKGTAGAVHWSHRPFFPIDTTYYVVPSHHAVSQVFCYFLLRTLGLNEMNNDSAVPGLNRNQAHASRIMLPCEAALNEFTSLATKLFSTAAQVERENSTLVLTRNALLPQLMSGKLRVKDAGKVLENAGV